MSNLSTSSVRVFLFLLVSVSLTVALYFPGLSGPFLFDDAHTVSDNEWVQVEDLELDTLRNASESFAAGGRELAMLSLALNHYFLGPDPYAYKAVNLAIHVVNGVLLYILTRILTGFLATGREEAGNFLVRWTPEIVVGLWLISPINLTSVLYVSQRMTSLAAMFTLIGILVYVSARVRHLKSGRFPWLVVPVLAVCLGAAYSSKENGMLLLPFLLLLEFMLFRFSGPSGKTSRVAVLLTGIGLVAGFIVVAESAGLHLSDIAAWYKSKTFTLEERVLTQGRVLIFYIGLVLFPHASRFGLWHDDFEISTSILSPIDTVTSIALLMLLIATAILTRRKYPLCTFGVLWFFVGHSMESTIIPLEMIHEHRNYLPSFGVILALVGFLGYLSRARTSLKMLLLGSLGFFAAFNLHARATAWGNEYLFAYHTFINHPTSARAAFQFARVNLLFASSGHEVGKQQAVELLNYARTLGDDTILPEVVSLVFIPTLDIEFEPQWIDTAIRKLNEPGGTPSDTLALRNLTDCVADGNCRVDQWQLRRLYQAAADTKITILMDEAARFFNVTGDNERAVDILKEVAERPGANVQTRLNYVRLLIALGRDEAAREQLSALENSAAELLFRQQQGIEEAWKRLGRP